MTRNPLPQFFRALFFCSVSIILFATANSFAASLDLPAEDLIAPRVDHLSSDRGTNPNGTIFFHARVHDNAGVQNVTVFYRTIGDKQYIALPMAQSDNDSYTALLSPDAVKSPGIEYYIQAKDTSGNAVLVGAAFSPMIFEMNVGTAGNTPGSTNAATQVPTENLAEQDVAEKPKSSNAKWWWIAAGVVAAGVIAASSSGGGGGGHDDEPSTPSATTGSLTVTAPLPQ